MIKSAIEIIYTPKFQCSLCIKKTAPAFREKNMNCTGKNKTVVRELDEIKFSRCPGNFYNPGYAHLLDVHRNFRKGVLGFPGGLMDQPAKYIDSMNLIENIVIGKELERMNAQNSKAKRQKRRA